jgi:hypothetical protein
MKHKSKFSKYYTLTTVALLLCVSNLAYAGKLNADEVEQLISGNTVVFEDAVSGRVITRYYAANGTFRQLNKKGNKTVKRNWSINDKGQLCNSKKGKGVCHIIYSRGKVWETYVEARSPTMGNKHILTIKKVLDGNPNGL